MKKFSESAFDFDSIFSDFFSDLTDNNWDVDYGIERKFINIQDRTSDNFCLVHLSKLVDDEWELSYLKSLYNDIGCILSDIKRIQHLYSIPEEDIFTTYEFYNNSSEESYLPSIIIYFPQKYLLK